MTLSAAAPLGHGSGAAVIVPGRRFGECLAVMCGLIRHYGASKPTVAHALSRLFAVVAADNPGRCAAIEGRARIVVSDAGREVALARGPCPHARRGRVPVPDSGQAPARVIPTQQPGEPRTPHCQGDTENTGTQQAVMAPSAARLRTSGSGQCYGRLILKPVPGARPSLQRAPTRLPCRGGGERQPWPAAARWVTGFEAGGGAQPGRRGLQAGQDVEGVAVERFAERGRGSSPAGEEDGGGGVGHAGDRDQDDGAGDHPRHGPAAPSPEAVRSMAALAATTTASARTAVAASRGPPLPGWMASASSCSSSATAPASQDRSRGGSGRAERPEGAEPTRTRTVPARPGPGPARQPA